MVSFCISSDKQHKSIELSLGGESMFQFFRSYVCHPEKEAAPRKSFSVYEYTLYLNAMEYKK